MSDLHYLTPGAIWQCADQQLRSWIADPAAADVFTGPLRARRERAGESGTLGIPPMVPIPALVHAAITGCAMPALPLCGAAYLAYIGIDLLDDLMDGDETGYWQGDTPGQHLLVAATLLKAPEYCITALDTSPAVIAELLACSARGLGRMATGQLADLRAINDYTTTPEAVLQSVIAKSGAMTSMLARWGAILAGATTEIADAYSEWGAAYGIAGQLQTDIHDLFREPVGSDLKNGLVTFPLACLVDGEPQEERSQTTELIVAAASDAGQREVLRELLQAKGAIAITVAEIQHFEVTGASALIRAEPSGPARDALESYSARRPATPGLVERNS